MASTPCAACKLLRRKCTQECVFAPYFPPTQPQKFICVHRVFGASNVTKILNDLPPRNREDAVKSLCYEAEARLRDPIYGCVGIISFLQQYLKKFQQDLLAAKEELAAYIGTTVLPPIGNNPPSSFMMAVEGMPPGVILQEEALMISQPHMSQQQPLIAADTQRMILDRGDHHHQQGMFNGYRIENNGSATSPGFNLMDVNDDVATGVSFSDGSFSDGYQIGQEAEHHINHDQLQPPLQERQEL